MVKYKKKLKCPNCNSRDIVLIQEKIFQEITFTNKRTGWLRKKSEIELSPVGNGASWFECNNCGCRSGDFYHDSDFIVKEVLDNEI